MKGVRGKIGKEVNSERLRAFLRCFSSWRSAPAVLLGVALCVEALAPTLYFELLDEHIRQYFWLPQIKTTNDSGLNVAILDLYTAESYNAAPEHYSDRYALYTLPKSLDTMCRLGVKRVAFDFYLDYTTWIGKHLLLSPRDQSELISALSCFNAIYLPVRIGGSNRLIPPIDPLATLDKVVYVHTGTVESVLYPAEKRAQVVNGELIIPYLALAIAGIGANGIPDFLPIQPGYYPDSFARFRFEDLNVFNSLSTTMPEAEFRNLYSQYYKSTYGLPIGRPELIILGFGHDALDAHDVAINKVGPIKLPPLKSGSGWGKGLSSVTTVEFGMEPPVELTPGMYLVAATSATLVRVGVPTKVLFKHPALLLGLWLIGVLLVLGAKRASSTLMCSIKVLAAVLVYLLAVFLLHAGENVFLPITLPVAYFAGLYIYCDYHLYQGVIHRLFQKTLQYRYEVKKEYVVLPYILHQSASFRDCQLDPYKRLIASLDLLCFWLQFLALTLLSEHFEKNSGPGPISKQNWLKWSKPTLGSYLYGFKELACQYKSYQHALGRSRFPEFTILLHGENNLHEGLGRALHEIVQLRNEWKHFASSGHSEISVRAALASAGKIEQILLKLGMHLPGFILVRAKVLVKNERSGTLWTCMVFNGHQPYLDEFMTRDILTPGYLYLCDIRKKRIIHNLLCLHPWMAAGECKYHHRDEIFLYSGLVFDFDKSKPTRQVKYTGFTESCQPVDEHLLLESAVALLISEKKGGSRGRAS